MSLSAVMILAGCIYDANDKGAHSAVFFVLGLVAAVIEFIWRHQ